MSEHKTGSETYLISSDVLQQPLIFIQYFHVRAGKTRVPGFGCIRFVWQGFGSRGSCRGGFCMKLTEVSPVTNAANASQRQDGLAAGQGSNSSVAAATTLLQQQQW